MKHAKYSARPGRSVTVRVPADEAIKLSNAAVNLDATILYADLCDSTDLVDHYKPQFAAEVYKTYLLCAAKIIRSEGGTITAYDGDRIMAVYLGGNKNTSAVRTALKVHYAVKNIIMPSMKTQYPTTTYTLKQAIGIDSSKLFVARTGVRGANDLVWVGRAANYAAKLASLNTPEYLPTLPALFTKICTVPFYRPTAAVCGKNAYGLG
jgi:class 3 adenylate cyclase